MQNSLMAQCPNFRTCNSPKCPLDPEMKSRLHLQGESFCNAQKSTILRLAQGEEKLLPWIANKDWWGSFKAAKSRNNKINSKNKTKSKHAKSTKKL
jgi:hypothetical protein